MKHDAHTTVDVTGAAAALTSPALGSRGLLTATLLAAVAVGGSALWAAAANPPSGWEIRATRSVATSSDAIEPVAVAVMQLGARPAIVVAAAVVALTGRRRWRLAGAIAVSGVVAWAAAELLKRLVERPRPGPEALAAATRETASGFGYPSSHAAIAGALATAVLLGTQQRRRGRRAAVALGLAACCVALARVYVGVHWVLDVAGGLAVGALAAALVALAIGRQARS